MYLNVNSATNHVVHSAKIHARCATNEKNFARHSQTVLSKNLQVTRESLAKRFKKGLKMFALCAIARSTVCVFENLIPD